MAKVINDSNENEPQEKLGTGLTILSFCIPIAGAIIYFSKKKDSPEQATTACHAALWGAGVGLLLNILATLGGAN